MFIDTHCHLTFEDYKNDLDTVLSRAKKAGVEKCIVPGVDFLSNKLSIELARQYPGIIFSAIGFHPYEASHNPPIHQLETLLTKSPSFTSPITHTPYPLIVALGECGLDYHLFKGEKAEGKKQVQRLLFEEHIRLALKHNLPLTMHCRDAYDDFWNVLDNATQVPRGVIHCFSGGLQDLRMAIDRNLFIGIDGNVTYSKHLQLIVPHIPLNHLLLETDAPYLTPVPHRGSPNEPMHIPLIAQEIARLKRVSVDEVEKQTTENAQTLFFML